MNSMFSFLSSRLWIKVLIPISFCVLLVMGFSLWMNVAAQSRMARAQIAVQNTTLASAIEGGMFDALAVGDNDTVRAQFRKLSEKVRGLKVYVYDFNRQISFSTERQAVGRGMDQYTSDRTLDDIEQMIRSGHASGEAFRIRFGEEVYIGQNAPILNVARCVHCHGQAHKVLGGISVFSSTASTEAEIRQGRLRSIGIAGAGICLIMLLVWMVFHFVVNNKVGQVLSAAARLREKDFTQTFQMRHGDEINHILNRIGRVTEELRQIIEAIIQNSKALDASSTEMSRIADSLDESSANTSQKVASVSDAAGQMTRGNAAITSTMADASESLHAIAAAVEEMTATAGEIAKNASESKRVIDTVVQKFGEILDAVEDLGEKAQDVDDMTDEIRAISEQVSMLALNARIEAARAGDAGKGFAVVAQEITELAADTSQSTLAADKKLARMKSTVKTLVQQVNALTSDVKDSEDTIAGIAASVEEQNATTSEISKNINAVTHKIGDVDQGVSQGAQTASHIASDIASVEEMTSKVQAESHALNEYARTLSGMAQDFADLMKQFKI